MKTSLRYSYPSSIPASIGNILQLRLTQWLSKNNAFRPCEGRLQCKFRFKFLKIKINFWKKLWYHTKNKYIFRWEWIDVIINPLSSSIFKVWQFVLEISFNSIFERYSKNVRLCVTWINKSINFFIVRIMNYIININSTVRLMLLLVLAKKRYWFP